METVLFQVKENLLSCKMLLHCKRDELRKLWIEGIEHKHVLNLLDEIENIKQVPQKLEQCMASKHYLSATDMLVRAQPALLGVSAQIEECFLLFPLNSVPLEAHDKLPSGHSWALAGEACLVLFRVPMFAVGGYGYLRCLPWEQWQVWWWETRMCHEWWWEVSWSVRGR